MSNRTNWLIASEATKVKDRLANDPDSAQRALTKVAQLILLQGPYYFNGHRITPIAKSIGAGVWEISNKK